MSDWIPTLPPAKVDAILQRHLAHDPIDWSRCQLAQRFPRDARAPEEIRRRVYTDYRPGVGKARK